jgi:hypothetical protein
LPITSLASSTAAYQASQSDEGWQRFTQLVAAVNAGNLPAARKAYDGFAKSPAADLTRANPNNRLTRALGEVGEALQSGDIPRAQHALSTIRSRPPASSADAPPTVASPKTAPSEPNGPGTSLDVVI